MNKELFLALSAALVFAAGSAIADECADTHVKITESVKKFSVLMSGATGMETRSFDDIGCAITNRNNECATRQMLFDGHAAVVDYASGEELPAEKAFFVLKTDVQTPRGFGIVAFKDKNQAEQFSAGHGKGKVVRWFELVDEKLK